MTEKRNFPNETNQPHAVTDDGADPWCDWCQREFAPDEPNWKVETDVVTGFFCSKDCADQWSSPTDTPERVGDAQICADGGTQNLSPRHSIAPGPHECPHDDQFTWWESDGTMFYRGHEVRVSCCGCDEEMAVEDLIGGQEFVFICRSEACATEEERCLGDGTVTHHPSLGLTPAYSKPKWWLAYGDGFEGDVERTADGESWVVTVDTELLNDTYEFEIDAPTLAEEVDAR